MVIFLLRISWPQWPYRHVWVTNGCQIRNQRTKLPLEAQPPPKKKMTYDIDLWWPRLTSERSQCQCKPWMSPPNTYPCPHHQQKYRSSQVSGVETVRNANFAWHDLGNQVKGHSRYGLKIFREGVKLFKGYYERARSAKRVSTDIH